MLNYFFPQKEEEMHKVEIEKQKEFLTQLLDGKTTIIQTKVKETEKCVYFILDENSLRSEKEIRLVLERETTPKYKLVKYYFRFPVDGMVSPPPIQTLAISLSIYQKSTNSSIGLLELTFFHLLVIGLVLVLHYGMNIILAENVEEVVFFNDDASISVLVIACFSTLHILVTCLWRDTKKIEK